MKVKDYNLEAFCIDILSNEYKTKDPVILSNLIKKILKEDIKPSTIQQYFNTEEDFEKESRKIEHSLTSNDIFYD